MCFSIESIGDLGPWNGSRNPIICGDDIFDINSIIIIDAFLMIVAHHY